MGLIKNETHVWPALRERAKLIKAVAHQRFKRELGRCAWAYMSEMDLTDPEERQPVDLLFAGPGQTREPRDVFTRLRWGGRFVYVSPDETAVQRLANRYRKDGSYVLEQDPDEAWVNTVGLRIPGITPRGYVFVARKTRLVPAGCFTNRFTYDLSLVPDAESEQGYVVRKKVPSPYELFTRLQRRLPETPQDELRARTEQLTSLILPTLLTREAAMLQTLREQLPEHLRPRVPGLIGLAQDPRGLAQRLDMTWLPPTAHTLSQIAFAKQSTELLAALHDTARIAHLDLRLDNIVIADIDGEPKVCFVDFGSAVSLDEDLDEADTLSLLIDEMQRTSQVQRLLRRMVDKGQVTSQALCRAQGHADPHVDTFYLAVQINRPDHNPDLRHAVEAKPDSPEAVALANLTAALLRPKNAAHARYKTAGSLMRGIRRIAHKLELDTR